MILPEPWAQRETKYCGSSAPDRTREVLAEGMSEPFET
jgi:hypothetical protein